MFAFAIILLLALHLLAANVAMAGPIVALWLEWHGTGRDDILAQRTAERLARDSVKALFATVVLGLILLGGFWIRGDGDYFRTWQLVPRSRLWFAIGELVFSLILLSVYAFAWQKFAHRRSAHRLIAIFGASNLIYHFPPLFAAISQLTSGPNRLIEPLQREPFRRLLFSPPVLAISLHVWLASAAVVGTLLFYYAIKLRKKNAAPNDLGTQPKRIATWGARLALFATIPQLIVGVWLLLTLPDNVRDSLLGEQWLATAVFAIGVLAALRLMHVLASIAFGDQTPRNLYSAIVLMLATVVIMTATLQLNAQRSVTTSTRHRSSQTATALNAILGGGSTNGN